MILLQEIDLLVQGIDLVLERGLLTGIGSSEVITILQISGQLSISGGQRVDFCLGGLEIFLNLRMRKGIQGERRTTMFV